MSMTRLTPKLHSLTTLVSPKSSICNISISNGPIALKLYTEVKYLKLHKNKRPTGLIAPPFIMGFLDTCLVIICPNSYEKLTKVKSSSHIGVGSNIAQNHSSNI